MNDHKHPQRAMTERTPCALVAAVRRLGFGRNPLCRTSERIQAVVVLLAIVVGLAAIPVAAAVGTAVYRSAAEAAQAARATTELVQVRTLEDSPPLLSETPAWSTDRVRAEWRDKNGIRHEVTAEVAVGTQAGARVTAWVDEKGNVTHAPASAAAVLAASLAAGLGILVASWAALLLVVLGLQWVFNWIRLRGWQAEWESVEPSWSRDAPPV
jgi:hypothetical protein